MSALQRLHDKLVQAEGHDCRCDPWGPPRCPAMQAAITRRQREHDTGQLELTTNPAAHTYNQLPDDY